MKIVSVMNERVIIKIYCGINFNCKCKVLVYFSLPLQNPPIVVIFNNAHIHVKLPHTLVQRSHTTPAVISPQIIPIPTDTIHVLRHPLIPLKWVRIV